MKKLALLYFLIVFVSCQEAEKSKVKSSKTIKKSATTNKLKNKSKFDYRLTLEKSFFDSIHINFSSLTEKDIFTFQIPKGDINKTVSILKIANNSGNTIYEKRFETYLLINGYELESIHNENEMLHYILKQAKNMLAKNSFIDINENQKEGGWISTSNKKSFYDYETYESCKIEKRLLFSISLGEEDTEVIGYSSNEGKVKEIIGCC